MAAFPRAACVSVCPGPTYTLHVIYLLGSVRARQNSPGFAFAPDPDERYSCSASAANGAIISCLPENGFKLLKKKKKIQIWEQTTDRENEERVHFCTAPEERGRRNQTLARQRATK